MTILKVATTVWLLGAAALARPDEAPSAEAAKTPEASADDQTTKEEKKEEKAEELAKKTQNPLADLYLFPFQDNIGFDYGPNKDVQNVLNFQPVVPLHFGALNVITRTIVPIVTQPSPTPGGSSTTALGDITLTAFLSPAGSGTEFILGIGPVVSFPSATSPLVGSQSTWGLGPSAVALTMPGPRVIGGLVNNIWSVAGTKANNFLLQPFVNYNFKGGWY